MGNGRQSGSIQGKGKSGPILITSTAVECKIMGSAKPRGIIQCLWGERAWKAFRLNSGNCKHRPNSLDVDYND